MYSVFYLLNIIIYSKHVFYLQINKMLISLGGFQYQATKQKAPLSDTDGPRLCEYNSVFHRDISRLILLDALKMNSDAR